MTDYINNIVCTLRKHKKVTQEELASAVGVTRQTIIAIEKGNYTPSLLLAIKIARFFDKTVEEVFNYHYER
jgi:putative transcriptional regulator